MNPVNEKTDTGAGNQGIWQQQDFLTGARDVDRGQIADPGIGLPWIHRFLTGPSSRCKRR